MTSSDDPAVRGHAAAMWTSEAERPHATPRGELTVLVIGTDEWAIEQGVRAVETGGHRALRCHAPGEPAFPCNALIEGRMCPLDVGFDVVVTVRGRPGPSPTFSEFGAVCAIHEGRPLVVAGLSELNPFAHWAARTVAPDGDIVGACEEAVAGHGLPAGAGVVVEARSGG